MKTAQFFMLQVSKFALHLNFWTKPMWLVLDPVTPFLHQYLIYLVLEQKRYPLQWQLSSENNLHNYVTTLTSIFKNLEM